MANISNTFGTVWDQPWNAQLQSIPTRKSIQPLFIEDEVLQRASLPPPLPPPPPIYQPYLQPPQQMTYYGHQQPQPPPFSAFSPPLYSFPPCYEHERTTATQLQHFYPQQQQQQHYNGMNRDSCYRDQEREAYMSSSSPLSEPSPSSAALFRLLENMEDRNQRMTEILEKMEERLSTESSSKSTSLGLPKLNFHPPAASVAPHSHVPSAGIHHHRHGTNATTTTTTREGEGEGDEAGSKILLQRQRQILLTHEIVIGILSIGFLILLILNAVLLAQIFKKKP